MSTASNKVKAPLIETRKLKKYFPLKRNSFFDKNQLYVRAVEDLTMNIYKGETLGLVGESGCGKSTLGRSILQLYPLTSGSAIYYGKTVEVELKTIATIDELYQLLTPEFLHHEIPVSLSSKQVYSIVREPAVGYIQRS